MVPGFCCHPIFHLPSICPLCLLQSRPKRVFDVPAFPVHDPPMTIELSDANFQTEVLDSDITKDQLRAKLEAVMT